jgi:scytalone dehydratase
MAFSPSRLDIPVLEAQHFIGGSKWEKTGEDEITGYHKLPMPHHRHTDETRTEI